MYTVSLGCIRRLKASLNIGARIIFSLCYYKLPEHIMNNNHDANIDCLYLCQGMSTMAYAQPLVEVCGCVTGATIGYYV